MNNTINKRCHVCGDKAVAFNHNGLSCQSCKMFFRRNIQRTKKLKCKYEEACVIDKYSRKYCAKCRLDKCVSIGMSDESIGKNTHDITVDVSSIKIEFDESQLPSEQLTIKNILEFGIDKEGIHSSECLRPRRSKKPLSLELTKHEQGFIDELQNAMQIFDDESKLNLYGEVQSKAHAFNLHANYARRIVKFCKQISAFKALNSADQLKILKSFYFEINFTRMAFTFGPEAEAMRLIGDESGDHVFAIKYSWLYKNVNFHQNILYIIKYKNSFHLQMDKDTTIRNLIIAQLLFKTRKNLNSPELISYEYNLYTRLLWRYLEAKYNDVQQAEEKHFSLMLFLKDINSIREKIIEIISTQIDPTQVNQVLKEVFEL